MKFGIFDENITAKIVLQKRHTAKNSAAGPAGQKTVHFNRAERGYIIGVRGRQTKSSASAKHGGTRHGH